MLKLNENDLLKIDEYMQNKTRDIELACYNYHIYQDERINVSYALSMYQNTDGGFGKGLNPDLLVKSSSPISTSFALEMLKNVDYNKDNLDDFTKKMVNNVFKYIFLKAKWKGSYLYPVSNDTNNYPHASWLDYKDTVIPEFEYSPLTEILAYGIYFLDEKNPYYKKALNLSFKLVDEYLNKKITNERTINSFKVLYEVYNDYQIEYRNEELFNKIIDNIQKIINQVDNNLVINLISSNMYITNENIRKKLNESLDYLIESRTFLGAWDYLKNWDNKYEDEYEVSRIKWSGYITLSNLLTLKRFKRI